MKVKEGGEGMGLNVRRIVSGLMNDGHAPHAQVGFVTGLSEVAIGMGFFLGPPIGSVLHAFGTAHVAYIMPFAVLSVLLFAQTIFFLYGMWMVPEYACAFSPVARTAWRQGDKGYRFGLCVPTNTISELP